MVERSGSLILAEPREQSNGVPVQVRVKLPAEALLEFWTFCHAIAEAVWPTKEQELTGIACIVGKQITRQVSMAPSTNRVGRWPPHAGLQRVLLSDDGRTLDEILLEKPRTLDVGVEELPLESPAPREVVEWPTTGELDPDDRRLLEGLLPQLPPLRCGMSEADKTAFWSAYYNTPGRPTWAPILMTEADLMQRKRQQDATADLHRKALQIEFADGRLMAVNGRNAPVPMLTTGSFIPRNQAIAYLERCGLTYRGDEVDAGIEDDEQSMQPEREVVSAAMPSTERSTDIADPPPSSAGRKAHAVDQADELDVARPARAVQHIVSSFVRPEGKVARLKRVSELTGLGRSSIYNRMDSRSPYYDPTFPRSFPLGSTTGSAVGWSEEEIHAWVAAQAGRDSA